MRDIRHAMAVLVAVGSGFLGAVAEEPPSDRGYKSPEAVFAAYMEAKNAHDWKKLFSLGTTELQDAQLVDFAIGAACSEEDTEHPDEIRTYRAIMQKYGIDWRQVRNRVNDAKAGGDQDAPRAYLRRMVDRVRKRADLFAAVNDFFAKAGDPIDVTVHELRNLMANDATASGDSIETSIATEVTIDPQTRRKSKRRVQGQLTARLFFRRIDGNWYLDVEKQGP